ncbi:MAG TPA: hypothetical protein VF937_09335, partial [Chloroflexota bacterium]
RWYAIQTGMVNLFPGGVANLELHIHLPDAPDTLAGTHQAILKIISREAPDVMASVTLPIEVLAVGGVQASLTPQRRTVGKRGFAQYAFELASSGNADSLLDLVVRDPEEALQVRVDPDRVSVPHGSKTQARVQVRPRKRPLVAPERMYTFMIEASRPVAEGEAAETQALVVGELVYRAPLVTLAALPLTARRLLIGLAALALAAALLIWFLAAPGRRGALIERVPPLKPAVAAVESALNLPDKVASPQDNASAAQAPRINKFELVVPGQDGRTDYALVWQVDGADKVTIDGADQPDPNGGTLRLDKVEGAEHVLQASRGGVTVSQSVGIVILARPDIQELGATPETISAGQSTTLHWKAVRGDRASLADKTVDPSGGSLQVSPTATTTYTLVVENELGRGERSVQVTVAP